MTRLVQIKKGNIRRVALVDEPKIRLLDTCSSIYEMAQIAVSAGMKLSEVARQRARLEPCGILSMWTNRNQLLLTSFR